MGDNNINRKYTKKHKILTHNPRKESSKMIFGEPRARDDTFTPRTFK